MATTPAPEDKAASGGDLPGMYKCLYTFSIIGGIKNVF